MIQINLIPDVKIDLIRAQKHRNMIISFSIISMIATVSVVVLVAFYIFGAQAWRDKLANDNIKRESQNLLSIEDLDKNVTIQNQLATINATHEDKLMTSRIFGILNVLRQPGTQNEVNILSFALSKDEQTISLIAQTKNGGFEAADIFKKNIEALLVTYKPINEDGSIPESQENQVQVQLAKDVVLSSPTANSANGGAINFNITFTYSKDVFSMKNHIEELRGLGKGNVTDSYMRLPSDLLQTTTQNTQGGGNG